MRTHRENQKGAAAVEMAMIAPFLILLLLGTVEFSYKFAQYNEIRHSAREAARFAAVSNEDLDIDGTAGIQNNDIVLNACNSLNLPSFGTVTVTTTRADSAIGSIATVQVSAAVGSLSNAPFITGWLPSSLDNTATFRLEQEASWTAGSGTCP
jgi:Flp pilus assembly protein TadG